MHEQEEGQKKRERGNPKQTPPLSAEPNVGLNLMTLRSWLKPKLRVRHLTDWATQVGAPLEKLFSNDNIYINVSKYQALWNKPDPKNM